MARVLELDETWTSAKDQQLFPSKHQQTGLLHCLLMLSGIWRLCGLILELSRVASKRGRITTAFYIKFGIVFRFTVTYFISFPLVASHRWLYSLHIYFAAPISLHYEGGVLALGSLSFTGQHRSCGG